MALILNSVVRAPDYWKRASPKRAPPIMTFSEPLLNVFSVRYVPRYHYHSNSSIHIATI
jgi:hypothetical protein